MAANVAYAATRDGLERAARDASEAREAYDAALEMRNRLIVDAADLGMPQRAIAKATRLSQPRVLAIVLNLTGQADSAAPTPPHRPTPRTPGTTRTAHQQRPAAAVR